MAVSVIDALVVTLGLDGRAFRRGQKQAGEDLDRTKEDANRAAKQIEASGAVASRFFSRMRNEALALFAVFTAGRGIKDFIRDITLGDAAAGLLAQKIGISTETLTAWQGAADRAGGSAQATGQTLLGLRQAMENFALTGEAGPLAYFRDFVQLTDEVTGKMRPLGDILLDVADKFQTMTLPQALARGRLMGIDDGTIALLHKGRAEVEGLLQAQRTMGVPGDADAARALSLINKLKDIQQTITNVARSALKEVSPEIELILTRLEKWLIEKSPAINKALKQFGEYLLAIDWAKLEIDIKDFAKEVDHVVGLIGGWTNASELLLALWIGPKLAAAILGVTRFSTALAGSALGRILAGLAVLAPLLLTGPAGQVSGDSLSEADQMAENKRLHDEYKAAHPEYREPWDRIKDWWRRIAPESLGGQPGGPSEPRGIRNNNPLNLEYAPGQGATGSDGRFGVYPTMEAGISANASQLLRYQDVYNRRTIAEIIERWAPAKDGNDTKGYIDSVAGMLKINPYDPIDLHDPDMMSAMIIAMGKRESGRVLSPDLVMRGVRGQPAPPAIAAAPLPTPPVITAPAPALDASARLRAYQGPSVPGAAAVAPPAPVSNDNRSSAEVHINGPITVETRATDAPGVARGLGAALRQYALVPQATSGLA